MAYGETLTKLSPCDNELICSLVSEFDPMGGPVLDVGCGRGERLSALAERFPGRALAGIDRDADMVEMARANVKADIRPADAAALPFEEESFGLVLCECSLSLFDRPEKSLREMHRVLKREGVLLLGDIYGRLLPENVSGESSGGIIGRVYGRGNIELMAEEAGFELLRYTDRSGDLAAMAAQMIFDGSCSCLDADTLRMLRRVKAGYGLWIFKKEDF